MAPVLPRKNPYLKEVLDQANGVLTRQEFNDAFARIARMVRMGRDDLTGMITKRLAEIKDGYTPVKGKDYFDGKPGKPGKPGPMPVAGVHFPFPKDGHSPDPAEVVPLVLAQIQKPKDGSPDTADDIRNKLELLTGEDRLHISAIHGVDDHLTQAFKKLPWPDSSGGAAVSIMQSGALKMQTAQKLNFKGNHAPTVTVDEVGVTHLDFSATAGGVLLTTSGVIDDSNTVFGFSKKPSLINVNGTFYRETKGWSWNASTLQATLDSAVGTGGDIYALS